MLWFLVFFFQPGSESLPNSPFQIFLSLRGRKHTGLWGMLEKRMEIFRLIRVELKFLGENGEFCKFP